MIFRVVHQTAYDYQEPVSLCHNIAHLLLRPAPRQSVRDRDLVIQPAPAITSNFDDYFGNPVVFFGIQEPHRRLTVRSIHTIEVEAAVPTDPSATPAWEESREALALDLEAFPFTFDSAYAQADDALRDYALPSFTPGRPILEAALDLTRRIHADFRYDPKATTVATPLHDVLLNRCGVCQDFAHLEIACLRSLGLAARYVSGYLRTRPPPGKERLTGADASHAWVSVYCPSAGWVDLDPTNDSMPSDQHIVLAWGRDYDDVTPIRGVILGGSGHSVKVSVDVEPIAEKK